MCFVPLLPTGGLGASVELAWQIWLGAAVQLRRSSTAQELAQGLALGLWGSSGWSAGDLGCGEVPRAVKLGD